MKLTQVCFVPGLCIFLSASVRANTNVTYGAGLALKVGFDSNVYLQNTDPAPTNVAAAQAAGLNPVEAGKGSWVSAITPSASFGYRVSEGFRGDVNYAPSFNWYHNAHSEDHITHLAKLDLGGTVEEATWSQKNVFTLIDGNSLGPTFASPGAVPSIGGVPIRNRRDAFVYVGTFGWTQKLGEKWLLRPVARGYVHDFMTDQLPNPSPSQFVYENYIDRSEANGGLDVGLRAGTNTYLIVGYRYGAQHQGELLGASSPYQNNYQRVLFGVEGSPVPWLKLNFLLGPDFRDFYADPPAGFNTDQVVLYANGSISVLPTEQDKVTYLWVQYEQPAFGCFGMYEDITHDLSWDHRFDEHWSAGTGFRLYIGDWFAPVQRDDWIYTARACVAYKYDKHLSAELAYSYDWSDSKVPDTSGRTFTRNLVWLSVQYRF